IADRVAHPLHDGVGFARTHRAPHHVLDTAIRTGEWATTRRIERGHCLVEESGEVPVVDNRQLRVGDERHQYVVAAGLGADSLTHRVVQLEFAAKKVLDYLAPKIFRLANHRADATVIE